MDPSSPGRELLDGLHRSERLLKMLCANNRILLGVVLLTISSIAMAQTAPHRKLASAARQRATNFEQSKILTRYFELYHRVLS